MLEKESACTEGIGFVACMDDWTMKHFSTDYCFQVSYYTIWLSKDLLHLLLTFFTSKFMQGLQGKLTPVNVVLFLIVNPLSWFGAISKIMQPMLVPSFGCKVKVIVADKLPKGDCVLIRQVMLVLEHLAQLNYWK